MAEKICFSLELKFINDLTWFCWLKMGVFDISYAIYNDHLFFLKEYNDYLLFSQIRKICIFVCTSKFSYITSHDLQTIWSKSANAKQLLMMCLYFSIWLFS